MNKVTVHIDEWHNAPAYSKF